MTRTLLLLSAILLIATPADAQSRREMAQRLDAAEARIAEMESRFMAGDPVADRLLTRVDALERELGELTGEVERLNFENRQLRQSLEELTRQVARRTPQPGTSDGASLSARDADSAMTGRTGRGDGPADLTGGYATSDPDDPYGDAREAATRPLGATRAAAGADVAPAISSDQVFGRARARLAEGDYAGAQEGFLNFVEAYPDDSLTGEAQYWLGETYFVDGAYADAADAYIASLRAAPQGAKAPDAMVRLASSLGALGRTDDACETLARFGRQFPNAGPEARSRASRESLRAGCR
ncbi:tol-pal system protein YbgF [Hyphobacterium marinum]|uniref:Cell division coordinator CpoB n=1 Tax=Hyphobacterium marinum TaxID=3116574 RepID=A0ABU7LXZ2_9PROT|nr:tol-pal system protein YbgF [Hyphobacterium sp. Y6023]MEE2566405.1 tol-pal system protein YbgF [Hyphobacterium sp. Y6023]